MDDKTMETLMQIRQYIAGKYPDSCIAVNSPEEDILKEIVDFFKYEILGFCGCGDPDSSAIAVRDYLAIVKHRHSKNDEPGLKRFDEAHEMMEKTFGVKTVYENPLLQFMAYNLDNAGLTDHGTAINGAWLKELGKICLYVLDLYIKMNVESDDEDEGSDPEKPKVDDETTEKIQEALESAFKYGDSFIMRIK